MFPHKALQEYRKKKLLKASKQKPPEKSDKVPGAKRRNLFCEPLEAAGFLLGLSPLTICVLSLADVGPSLLWF